MIATVALPSPLFAEITTTKGRRRRKGTPTHNRKHMTIGVDVTKGSTISIEFIRNGEHHQSARWCSDESMAAALGESDYIEDIRNRYAAVGAEILKIVAIERTEVCLG